MKRYICNPIVLNYPTKAITNNRAGGFGFQVIHPHRGTGDPSVEFFKGKYYMTGSFSGFWYSENLVDWYFKEGEGMMRGAAGDFCAIGDYLYHTASSTEKCIITRSKDPLNEKFELVATFPFAYWDPCLFLDDDGRVYLYHGCSNVDPIYGIELDRETMMPIGENVILIPGAGDPDKHGWERHGTNNDPSIGKLRVGETYAPGLEYNRPWIEGPYMTKYNGKYYLQYAATGTEYEIYADGVYVSDKPLGPFTYCPNSPFSAKTNGFYNGAGHGSTFRDVYGNWWHATTMVGGTTETMRKTGLFPLGFDKDGIMYCNMNFSDYPHIMPDGPADPNSLFTGWMLLSYNKPVTASSTMVGHPTSYLTDENCQTYWAASRRESGEYIIMDLEKVVDMRAVQLYFIDHDVNSLMFIPNVKFAALPPEKQFVRHRWLLEGSVDGVNWEILCDKREADSNLAIDFIVFEEGKDVRYLRLTSYEMPYYNVFAMCGFRVFGHANGDPPAKVTSFDLRRDKEDPCTFTLKWEPSEGADGYNIKWGIAPDKLYHCTMIYGKNELIVHSLNADADYYLQIDAFNGSGITEGDCVPLV